MFRTATTSQAPEVVPGARTGPAQKCSCKCGGTSARMILTVCIWVARADCFRTEMSAGSLRCECSDSWVDEHFLVGFGMDQLKQGEVV